MNPLRAAENGSYRLLLRRRHAGASQGRPWALPLLLPLGVRGLNLRSRDGEQRTATHIRVARIGVQCRNERPERAPRSRSGRRLVRQALGVRRP